MQTRQARSDSKKNYVLKEPGPMELYKLEQNVIAITQTNKSKYIKILSLDPGYNLFLYQPNDKLRTEKAFKKELLLKQLDKLMDQETILDKKLAQLNFIQEIQSQEQSKLLDKEINPYQALRAVWAKHQKTAIQAKNSSDRLESLNWTIGMIKNTVISMKLKQQQANQSNPSQAQPISHRKYQKLLLDYNRSLMVNQQLRQQIIYLQKKIQAKCQIQNQIQQKLKQKQKEIRSFKKIKETTDVDHKLMVAQLEQELFLLSKKLEKLQKWKVNLEKTSIEHNQKQFRLYFDILDQNYCIQDKNFPKITSKNVVEILESLKKHNYQNESTLSFSNPSEFLNVTSFDQQNGEIIIPTLSLTELNDQFPTRKKMPTDRPLKNKNFDLQKFVGNKIVNVKFSKLSQANLNDETVKKFVRKNPVLGTSRRLEPQCSERYLEPVSNSNN